MSAKFHDKLAEQALEQALNSHAEAIQQQRSMYAEKESLQARLADIEKELPEITKQQRARLPAGTELSVAAIDAALDRQMVQLQELNEELSRGNLRLKLIRQACLDSTLKVNETKHQVDEARATLAAAFERHILKTSEVKEAFALLRRVWATWAACINGPGYFDSAQWATKLAQEPPTDEEYAAARELLRVSDE